MGYKKTIRKADTRDIDQIMQIWKTENIKAHNFISVEYWDNNFCVVKNALPLADIYVAVCENEIIGFIGITEITLKAFS